MEKRSYHAVCVLEPQNGKIRGGYVRMRQIQDGPVELWGKIEGLEEGAHGFHVHELGDLTEGCKTAGGHYNPFNKKHGGPKDIERHIGDLGNVYSKGEEITEFHIIDHQIRLNGKYNIIGRSMVLHQNEDDLGKGNNEESLKTGNAGQRIACGVIGKASKFLSPSL